MPHRFATVECKTFPTSSACVIRVRYADAPGTLTGIDFAACGPDCHLVQIQPTRDRTRMEVHFTGCRHMLADLLRVLDVRDIEEESYLLSPFCGEYRQAGLYVGMIRELLDEDHLMARLRETRRPVEFARALLGSSDDPGGRAALRRRSPSVKPAI